MVHAAIPAEQGDAASRVADDSARGEDVDDVSLVNRYRPRIRKDRPLAQVVPRRGKYLHAIIAPIEHVDLMTQINSDLLRPVEVSELHDKLPPSVCRGARNTSKRPHDACGHQPQCTHVGAHRHRLLTEQEELSSSDLPAIDSQFTQVYA